jgi:hypothetical protein
MTTHAISYGARHYAWPSIQQASAMLKVRIIKARKRGARRCT